MAKTKSKRKTKSKNQAAPATKATKVSPPQRSKLTPPAGYYPTKRDLRFSLLIWVTTLMMVGPTIVLMWQQPGASWWLGTLLFAVAMTTLWAVQSMHYRLETGRLRINVGPYRREIPLADIRSVTPTRNTASGPAMSLDRLEIVYTDRGKEETVLISPVDRDAFMQELGQLDRGLKRQDNGLQRR